MCVRRNSRRCFLWPLVSFFFLVFAGFERISGGSNFVTEKECSACGLL